MPETRRFQKPSDPATNETGEQQFRILCKGKTVGEVIDPLAGALASAEARNMDPLIVLEDLGMLAGSVTTLIKSLSRLLVGYPRTVTFWETSGLTEAFLSAMEPPPRSSSAPNP